MEMTIVRRSGVVRRDSLGAALPSFGPALRPRLGSAGAVVGSTLVGGPSRTATAPNHPRPLDVTPARTS